MIWLSWRQQRTELGIAAIALGVCAVALAITRTLMGYDYSALSKGCGASGMVPCDPASFIDTWSGPQEYLLALNIVPIVAAIFLGAPLVASEVERGTLALIWTQAVTRTRWIAAKASVIAVSGVLAGALLALLVSWWRGPFDAIAGTSMTNVGFDLEGTIPIGVFFFALALAMAASAVLRRTLPAMAVTLVIFSVVRVGVGSLVPHAMPTVILQPSVALAPSGSQEQETVGLTVAQWIVNVPCPPQSPAGQTCQSEATQIVPDRYFWPLQLLETAIYLSLGAALLVVAFHWVRHRIA